MLWASVTLVTYAVLLRIHNDIQTWAIISRLNSNTDGLSRLPSTGESKEEEKPVETILTLDTGIGDS